MMTEITHPADTLEDALYALAVAKPVPDADVLDDLVRQYPEHSAKLTDMAVTLALESLAAQVGDATLLEFAGRSDAVASAMSRFHNRLYKVRLSEKAAKTKATAPVNPFASLSKAALREFGASIGANTVFAIKLRDRLVDHETMTKGFQQHIADKARAPLEVVMTHFAQLSAMQAAVHYKADEKPVTGKKQSFKEAVHGSGLTAEQQTFLLGL